MLLGIISLLLIVIIGLLGYIIIKNNQSKNTGFNYQSEYTNFEPIEGDQELQPVEENKTIEEKEIPKVACKEPTAQRRLTLTEDVKSRARLTFYDEYKIRLRDGQLVSLCGEDLSEINNFIKNNNLVISRLVDVPEDKIDAQYEEAILETPSARNLNSFYLFQLLGGSEISNDIMVEMYDYKFVMHLGYDATIYPAS